MRCIYKRSLLDKNNCVWSGKSIAPSRVKSVQYLPRAKSTLSAVSHKDTVDAPREKAF